jgi:hypothetical protein
LEHVLGEINADGANLHLDDPSGDSLFNDHPLTHSMSGAGVVHHINRIVLTCSVQFRSTPVSGHYQDRRACLKGAKALNRCAIARCAGSPTASTVAGVKIVDSARVALS